jgi:hypothetical protein
MAGALSQGAPSTVRMSRNPFIATVEAVETTTIQGDQPPDVTEYCFETSKGAVISAELSKMEQILEYLKALYR